MMLKPLSDKELQELEVAVVDCESVQDLKSAISLLIASCRLSVIRTNVLKQKIIKLGEEL